MLRFPHEGKHVIRHMFGSNFELTRYVVFYQFLKKIISVGILKDIVKTDPTAHEHFLHSWDLPQFPEK